MDSDEDEQIGIKKANKKTKGRKKSTTTTTATTSSNAKATKKATKGRRIKNILESDSEDEQPEVKVKVKKQKLDAETAKEAGEIEDKDKLFKLDHADKLSTAASISTQLFTPTRLIHFVPLHDNQPLNWSHKVNLIGEKSIDKRVQLCDICKEPILFYGRLIPCKHVFCYDCAIEIQEKGTGCLRCSERILRIERNPLNLIFMCNHDKQCKRTYLSQRDLAGKLLKMIYYICFFYNYLSLPNEIAHIQHRHTKKDKSNSSSEKSLKLRSHPHFNKDESSFVQKSNHSHYPQLSLHTLQWTSALAASSNAGGNQFVTPNTFKFSSSSSTTFNRNYYP